MADDEQDDLPDLSKLSYAQRAKLIDKAVATQIEAEHATLARLRAQFEAICAKEGVTLAKVFLGSRRGTKRAIKYQDPDNPNNTWTGCGLTPRWITKSGKSKEAFLIKDGKHRRLPDYDKYADPRQALKAFKR